MEKTLQIKRMKKKIKIEAEKEWKRVELFPFEKQTI